MKYPTREGISIHPHEISLPDSHLNLNIARNFNNHHHEWTRKKMGQFALTRTLRDLSRHQSLIPRDVHQWLHDRYEPPVFPTPAQAMHEVMNAYANHERLRVYDERDQQYYEFGIPEKLIKQLHHEYAKLK